MKTWTWNEMAERLAEAAHDPDHLAHIRAASVDWRTGALREPTPTPAQQAEREAREEARDALRFARTAAVRRAEEAADARERRKSDMAGAWAGDPKEEYRRQKAGRP